MKRPRKVRSLVLRNYIGSAVVSFLVFTLIFVQFGFDLEDQIFADQVQIAADEIIQGGEPLEGARGTARAVPLEYFIGTDAMPDWLAAEIDPEAINRDFEIFAEEHGHFHVAVRTLENGQKIYFLLNARPFIRSTPQIKAYLIFIGFLAGVIFLVSLFFIYRMTRKVSKPLEEMAATLSREENLDARFQLSKAAPSELHTLAASIENRDKRIRTLLDREREFNRDASHELRTPLAVAFGAAEVLEKNSKPNEALTRLKTSLKDMQLLTEGILWLGRENKKTESCDISKVCQDCVAGFGHLVGDRDVSLKVEGKAGIMMPVPEAVAYVMVGNILRNGLAYTDKGEVTLVVKKGSVLVRDTGLGYGQVEPDREGFGVGLSLVERLSSHFSIQLKVKPRKEGGTEASLSW